MGCGAAKEADEPDVEAVPQPKRQAPPKDPEPVDDRPPLQFSQIRHLWPAGSVEAETPPLHLPARGGPFAVLEKVPPQLSCLKRIVAATEHPPPRVVDAERVDDLLPDGANVDLRDPTTGLYLRAYLPTSLAGYPVGWVRPDLPSSALCEGFTYDAETDGSADIQAVRRSRPPKREVATRRRLILYPRNVDAVGLFLSVPESTTPSQGGGGGGGGKADGQQQGAATNNSGGGGDGSSSSSRAHTNHNAGGGGLPGAVPSSSGNGPGLANGQGDPILAHPRSNAFQTTTVVPLSSVCEARDVEPIDGAMITYSTRGGLMGYGASPLSSFAPANGLASTTPPSTEVQRANSSGTNSGVVLDAVPRLSDHPLHDTAKPGPLLQGGEHPTTAPQDTGRQQQRKPTPTASRLTYEESSLPMQLLPVAAPATQRGGPGQALPVPNATSTLRGGAPVPLSFADVSSTDRTRPLHTAAPSPTRRAAPASVPPPPTAVVAKVFADAICALPDGQHTLAFTLRYRYSLETFAAVHDKPGAGTAAPSVRVVGTYIPRNDLSLRPTLSDPIATGKIIVDVDDEVRQILSTRTTE